MRGSLTLGGCGMPDKTVVKAGAIVNFSCGEGKAPRIIGQADYFGDGPMNS